MNFSIESLQQPTSYECVTSIWTICSEADNINYVIPSAEEFATFHQFIVAWDNNVPVGFIWNTDNSLNEVFGMVLPQYRHNSIFKELLKRLDAKDISFYGRPDYQLMIDCASHLGYNNINKELLMSYKGSLSPDEWQWDIEEVDNTIYYYIEKSYIGKCSFYETSSTINVYDVYVDSQHRNKGYGKMIVKDMLWNISESHKEIILQVNSCNIPAITVYEQCGFVTKDSIIYLSRGNYEKRN